jgi:hypothetical protein
LAFAVTYFFALFCLGCQHSGPVRLAQVLLALARLHQLSPLLLLFFILRFIALQAAADVTNLAAKECRMGIFTVQVQYWGEMNLIVDEQTARTLL